MNLHRWTLAASAFATAIALAGCGEGETPEDATALRTEACANVSAPSPIVTGGATMYPTSEGLNSVIGQLQERGESEFADSFAGVEVVPDQGYAIVYRVPSATFDQMVAKISGRECVHIRDAAYTAKALRALAEKVSGDVEYWRAQGIPVNSVGPLHDGSAVEVGVDAAGVERAKVELPKRYGLTPPMKIVERGQAVPT
jgi:hypothetical protein